VEGTVAIFGWRDAAIRTTADQATFRGWELDVNRLAFHPAGDKKAPRERPEREPEVRHWWDAFWKPVQSRPIDQDQATVHLIHAEALPQPENEDVMFIARQIGLFSAQSTGLTVGQGICLKHGHWDNRLSFVHECVHVSQYERLGGIRPFLELYLRECIDPGYPFGRLEQEAILVARDICKPAGTVVGGSVA